MIAASGECIGAAFGATDVMGGRVIASGEFIEAAFGATDVIGVSLGRTSGSTVGMGAVGEFGIVFQAGGRVDVLFDSREGAVPRPFVCDCDIVPALLEPVVAGVSAGVAFRST